MSEKKPGKTKILLILVVAVVIIGAGLGGFALASGPDPEAEETAEETEPRDGDVVEVGELTVSLAGPDSHYARVGLAVVLAENAPQEGVADRFPLLKDAALLTIADTSADRLRSREGLEELRATLTEIAHDIYPEGEVLRVILVEAIVT